MFRLNLLTYRKHSVKDYSKYKDIRNNNNNNNNNNNDFDIQTDHLISARRPNLMIINKKKRIYKIVDFAVPADHRIKP